MSSWDIAVNGAEPVRPETLAKFYQAFKNQGFRYSAFYPAYGMAETTLIVSGGNKENSPVVLDVNRNQLKKNIVVPAKKHHDAQTLRLAGSGRPWPEMKIVIADPQTGRNCEADRVGEIWVASPSVTQGYWEKPEQTREDFQAYLQDSHDGPFLRTGDLGFFHDGELFINGRLKDVIIIRGVNHYPQDIEATALQSHEALRPDGGAAFSVEVNQEERLMILYEIKRVFLKKTDFSAVATAMMEAVSQVHQIPVEAVVLLKPGGIPKTTSGKVQRQLGKKMFLNGEFEELFRKESPRFRKYYAAVEPVAENLGGGEPEIIIELRKWIAAILECAAAELDASESILALGLDSLTLSGLKHQIEQRYPVDVPLEWLFETDCTIDTLNEWIKSHLQPEYAAGLPLLTVDPSRRYQPFQMTELQHAYWIGCNPHLVLGKVAAHVYLEIDSDEVIDFQRLNVAWNRLIARHEMLKAVVTTDGRLQILENVPEYRILCNDFQHCGSGKVGESLLSVREKLSHQVFHKECWPLFAIELSLFAGKSRIHISLDLMVADVWSLNILLREWFEWYQNDQSLLPKFQISFADYIAGMEVLRQTTLYKQAKTYWQNRLSALPPAPQLPLAKAPDELAEVRFRRRSEIISQNTWRRLKAKAGQYGLTPSALLMAAFSKILSSWSKSARFTLNMTLFNRLDLHEDLRYLVGDFTANLLVEVDDTPVTEFLEFVRRIQKRLVRDLQHRYYSGVETLRDLERNRRETAQPLMPVVFTSALSSAASMKLNLASGFGRLGYMISQTPQVWFDHQVFEDRDELILSWDTIDQLFPENVLDQMFACYVSLIRRLAEDDQPWHLPLRSLIPEKQLQRRVQFNKTEALLPVKLLHEPFFQMAETVPEAPAVLAPSKTLSYGQVLRYSVKLAYLLRERRIRANELVAVYMHKGWEQVVAVLAILHAGGAYLSIDPDWPEERVRFILDNAGVKVILFNKDLPADSPMLHGRSGVKIDDSFSLPAENLPLLEPVQTGADRAYVMYTSGTTGYPKGVVISHQGASNTVLDINQRFAVTGQDRILALSSLNFDLSVYDIFGILGAGGVVVIPKPHAERDPDYLAALLQKEAVTIWNSVPALLELLVENLECLRKKLNLRLVLLSGDWIPINLPERMWRISEKAWIVSLGGATEASIWSIFHSVDYIDTDWISIPYGKPLSNQQIYLYNEKMGDCPEWVTGDLYIGGKGVAQGYLGDTEKTKHSFIFHPESGERLYRTGDLGRFLPEGFIQFLGREDFQVKMNGFRVELGEIESVLNQHPQVARSAVKKISAANGNEYLAGYIVSHALGQPHIETAAAASGATDYQTELIPETGYELLTDPQQRRLFKLSNPGIIAMAGHGLSLPVETVDFQQSYLKRASCRRFLTDEISLKQFGRWLGCLRKMEHEGLPKYQYASAGGLYPVQAYLQIKAGRIGAITAGLYYYHPERHGLIQVSDSGSLDNHIHVSANQAITEGAAFVIFLIGDLDAIAPMYGRRSRDYCLIEAGLIAQLLEQAAVESGLGLCQLGAFADESAIKEMLKLRERQILLLGIAGGLVNAQDPSRSWAPDIFCQSNLSHTELVAEITAYCKKKLPHYMVPSRWKVMETMPLTAVGKINYRELPVVEIPTLPTTAFLNAGGGQYEKILSDIITEITGLNKINMHTNFFELGIDSLTVVKIWRKAVEQLGLTFPVVKMFEYPNLSKLARFVREVAEDQSLL